MFHKCEISHRGHTSSCLCRRRPGMVHTVEDCAQGHVHTNHGTTVVNSNSPFFFYKTKSALSTHNQAAHDHVAIPCLLATATFPHKGRMAAGSNFTLLELFLHESELVEVIFPRQRVIAGLTSPAFVSRFATVGRTYIPVSLHRFQ